MPKGKDYVETDEFRIEVSSKGNRRVTVSVETCHLGGTRWIEMDLTPEQAQHIHDRLSHHIDRCLVKEIH